MWQPTGVLAEVSSKRLRLNSVGAQSGPTQWNQLVGLNSTKKAVKLESNPLWRKVSTDSSQLNATNQMFGFWSSGQGRHCCPVDMDIEKNDEALQNFHSPLNSVTEFPILST